MNRKLTREDEQEIIRLYTKDYFACSDIAKKVNVSRQGVWKALKRNHIDTRKRQFPVECYQCRKRFYRARKRIRNTVHPFCSVKCYHIWLGRNEYFEWRYGQKIARKQLEEILFNIPDRAIIHHRDGDCANNELDNLMVFKGQGDHVKWHREIPGVVPLWP